ncbi:InlB B-repeat-containing protein [Faecalibaculum rodentium]|uniref:InlB B-repeat-containing protein n=1 Tax=Faecalibaculum rodentium TaxID=1702221 RepID=UPI0023F50B92|nr:InlB B-repeat-containing protein [Faecalibaculum rodentium]
MDNQAERPGYQFAGWYVDEARTKRINPGGKLRSAITLYDKWIPILYPVSYDMNGGTNSRKNPQFISVESGVISLHPARKPGYRFDSWILEGERISVLPERITRPIRLHASFAPLYVVHFETDGGGRIEDRETDENGYLDSFRPPMKFGAEFTGWYLDPDCRWPFDFSEPLTADTTLYAGWKSSWFPVTYDTDGGINARRNPVRYSRSSDPVPLYPAIRKGGRFVGWQDPRGTILHEIPAGMMGPLKLKAVWRKVKSHRRAEE